MNDTKSKARNWFRHYFWSFFTVAYLSATPLVLYQLIGLFQGWPGLFLEKYIEADGSWMVRMISFTHPVFLGWLCFVALGAGIYTIWRRNDYVPYRDSGIKSQPGF